MISAGRNSFRVYSLTLTRFLYISRPAKKHYNYDLDHLIEWKAETSKLFGPVRKPTKTGKLKKTKKSLDLLIEENLQMLSNLSVNSENTLNTLHSTENLNSKYCSIDEMTVSDDTILHDCDFIPSNKQTNDETSSEFFSDQDSSMIDSVFDIPDDVLISFGMYDVLLDTGDKRNAIGHGQESVDEIVISKISAIPTSTSLASNKFMYPNYVNTSETNMACERSQKEYENTAISYFLAPVSNTSNISAVEPFLTKSKDKNVKVTKNMSLPKSNDLTSAIKSDTETKNSSQPELFSSEISIPKIKPIPCGTFSYASSNSFQQQTIIPPAPSFKFSETNSVGNLPLEPPESFNIITKIPMFPKESNDWQKRLDSQNLNAFKSDVEQMSLRALPSVKTILNKTMPEINRYFLNRWREGMIKKLGEDGFKKHQDETIRKGVNLHANIMESLSGKPANEIQIMPESEGHWCSMQSALKAVGCVKALETEVSHSVLLYRGVFDCLAHYKDMLCLIDWKTSEKPRPLLKNTYDDPVQITAYIGALNANDSYVEKYGHINNGVIVVAYSDGSPAHVHVMKRSVCEEHWQVWTERLYNFFQLTYTEKQAANAEKINTKNVMGVVASQ